jgi:branched-chain amino acid transport system ATP-binding protein
MILKVEKLTKRFGGLTANHRIDLEVQKGHIHALIGPNGAGKTTFFNLISGFLKPSSGAVFFKQREITGMPPHKIARLGIARTFQTTQLFEEATVLENVMIGNRLRTRSGFWDAVFRTRRERREEEESLNRAREALDFVGLSHLEKEPVSGITHEQKKRVA